MSIVPTAARAMYANPIIKKIEILRDRQEKQGFDLSATMAEMQKLIDDFNKTGNMASVKTEKFYDHVGRELGTTRAPAKNFAQYQKAKVVEKTMPSPFPFN
jgi:polyhydroxyalkanoate synthesis regulator phasin